MWSQPATPRQIAALKANGNYDGKYYSKGRAGQTIGESVRRAGNSASSLTGVLSTQPTKMLPDVLDDLAVDEHAPQVLTRVSYPEAINSVARVAIRHDSTANEKGFSMNQLALVNSTNAEFFAGMSSKLPAAVAAFDYIQELESMHLAAVLDHWGAGDPRQLHNLEKGWAIAKVNLAKEFARAENELVTILREAPSGTVASPEAAAQEVLWTSCSADLEKALLYKTHDAKGTSRPSQVLDVLNAEVRHRVEIAKIVAQGMVDVAKIKASAPPATSTGYEPCWGEVTGVKSFGAFITLPSGESGLLHVSELASLNGGSRVQDATLLVKVGQSLHVRVTGKRPNGKLDFALASEA